MFKKLCLSVLLGVIGAMCLPVEAQTNTPPPTPPSATNLIQLIGLSPSLQQIGSTILNAFTDAQPYISNDIVDLAAGGLYNKSLASGKFGGFLEADIPTYQQMGIGVGAAYLDNTLFDATVNLKLGTTATLPVIGKVYMWAASGPDYAFAHRVGKVTEAGGIGAYNFVGAEKDWDVGHGWVAGVNLGTGDISQISGLDVLFGARLSYHW